MTDYEKRQADLKSVEEILEKAGIKMSVGGCGCCSSPWVKFEHQDFKMDESEDFTFDMFEELSKPATEEVAQN